MILSSYSIRLIFRELLTRFHLFESFDSRLDPCLTKLRHHLELKLSQRFRRQILPQRFRITLLKDTLSANWKPLEMLIMILFERTRCINIEMLNTKHIYSRVRRVTDYYEYSIALTVSETRCS